MTSGLNKLKVHGVLPGFGLTFGYTIFYLSLIVLIPLSTIFAKTATLGWGPFWDVVSAPRVVAAFPPESRSDGTPWLSWRRSRRGCTPRRCGAPSVLGCVRDRDPGLTPRAWNGRAFGPEGGPSRASPDDGDSWGICNVGVRVDGFRSLVP